MQSMGNNGRGVGVDVKKLEACSTEKVISQNKGVKFMIVIKMKYKRMEVIKKVSGNGGSEGIE